MYVQTRGEDERMKNGGVEKSENLKLKSSENQKRDPKSAGILKRN